MGCLSLGTAVSIDEWVCKRGGRGMVDSDADSAVVWAREIAEVKLVCVHHSSGVGGRGSGSNITE